MLRIATVELEAVTPFMPGRFMGEPDDKLSPAEHDKLNWRQRMWDDGKGNLVINPDSFKLALSEASKLTPRKGPGGGNSTWTKNFDAGVMITKLVVPTKKDGKTIKVNDVECKELMLPSDGKQGGSTRVLKHIPHIPDWKATIDFEVRDDQITEDIFKVYLKESGEMIGIGTHRPRRRGWHGTFKVNKIIWR